MIKSKTKTREDYGTYSYHSTAYRIRRLASRGGGEKDKKPGVLEAENDRVPASIWST